MPEGLEAEIWREAATALVGRRVERVEATSGYCVPDDAPSLLAGEWVLGVRRHGKVVLLDTSGPVVGLRFGMTGRLVVDGRSPIESLEYASSADRAEWDRFTLWTGPEGAPPAIRINDPRRLGRVELDPDLRRLGPDALSLTAGQLRDAFASRTTTVKAALMDQSVVAGLGNLCVDEILFSTSIAPSVRVDELVAADVAALVRAAQRRLPAMLAGGGSTHGVLDPERRRRLGSCPRRGCHGTLVAGRLGGRTTVWCPAHQRSR